MDRYELNLRHVLDMETSNLRLSCIETYLYDSQPYILRMGTRGKKQTGKRPRRDIRARIREYQVS